MTDMTSELALRIDDAALTVPGVVRLYSAAPSALRSARQLASSEPLALSHLGGDPESLIVTVSVGVASGHETADTARLVAAAVRDALGTAAATARVHVRVSRIDAG